MDGEIAAATSGSDDLCAETATRSSCLIERSMAGTLTASEEAQLTQTVEMFETIALADPRDCQSLEILKEAYVKLGRQKEVIATSKRIAHAYVLMGQLSSAILEYEGLLQSCPNDSEIKAALEEIESKAQTASGGNGLADSTDSLACRAAELRACTSGR